MLSFWQRREVEGNRFNQARLAEFLRTDGRCFGIDSQKKLTAFDLWLGNTCLRQRVGRARVSNSEAIELLNSIRISGTAREIAKCWLVPRLFRRGKFDFAEAFEKPYLGQVIDRKDF